MGKCGQHQELKIKNSPSVARKHQIKSITVSFKSLTLNNSPTVFATMNNENAISNFNRSIWEIKAMKMMPGADQAQKMLEKNAKHNWSVNLLS